MASYLQQLLEYHQTGSGFQAGEFCATTEQAVSTLQQQYGLTVTGQCDETTWTVLTSEPAGEQTAERPPDDIAVSFQIEVAAPEECHTLEQLDDLPSNAGRTA